MDRYHSRLIRRAFTLSLFLNPVVYGAVSIHTGSQYNTNGHTTLGFCANLASKHQINVPFDNVNAALLSHEYVQPAARNLNDLSSDFLLGKAIVEELQSLQHGERVLLTGGGFFVYGLELARRGALVTVINSQDFYLDLLEPIMSGKPYRILMSDDHITEMNSVPIDSLQRIARALRVETPRVLRYAFSEDSGGFVSVGLPSEVMLRFELQKYVQKILFALYTLEIENRLDRHKGLVQDLLPGINIQVHRIIDVWDAFSYSSNRVALLNLYYSKLVPGGKAYILLNGRMNDKVTDGSSDWQQDLYSYLENAYKPLIRVVLTGGSRVLILEKPFGFHDDSRPLVHGLSDPTKEAAFIGSGGLVVPRDDYQIIGARVSRP